MHQAAVPQKAQVEIPHGVLEYTAVFKKPILEGWTVPAYLVSSALSALEPFGFKLDGVEVKTHTEKLNEYAIVFRRNIPGLTFTLGIGKLVIMAENLDWTEADQFIAAARAGFEAIVQKAKAELESQQVVLAVHIQLKNKPRHEVTVPLLSPMALQLIDGDLKFAGVILFREKASIIVDGSLAYANALFVRITREHPPDATFERMAEVLRADEEQFFDSLGLEGVL
jgi:hypothetical protein